MFKKLCFVILAILIIANSMVYAEDLNSLRNAIDRNNGTRYLGSEGKGILTGLSKDIFDIVRIITVTILVIRLFKLLSDFSKAGEDPGVQTQIKTKATWISLGIVFVINFWGIYKFTANLFK